MHAFMHSVVISIIIHTDGDMQEFCICYGGKVILRKTRINEILSSVETGTCGGRCMYCFTKLLQPFTQEVLHPVYFFS
jgi:hypothetical protein